MFMHIFNILQLNCSESTISIHISFFLSQYLALICEYLYKNACTIIVNIKYFCYSVIKKIYMRRKCIKIYYFSNISTDSKAFNEILFHKSDVMLARNVWRNAANKYYRFRKEIVIYLKQFQKGRLFYYQLTILFI